MGWKNVKEHYRIEHIVQVTKAGICIGSSYIPYIIVIGLDGEILKRDDGRCNKDLRRYMAEFDADPELLRRLVCTPDSFGESTTVYTYNGGSIIEKQCEETGWPNVTHDGELMYHNTFSTCRNEVIKWARRNAVACLRLGKEHVALLRKQLAEAEEMLREDLENCQKLRALRKSEIEKVEIK